jgi:hypothetical protein
VRLLVSGTKGANGAGHGPILAFDLVGNTLGTFGEDSRIADPRGLCVDPTGDLLYVNSGNDRVPALNQKGQVLKTPARSTHSTPAEESSDLTGALLRRPLMRVICPGRRKGHAHEHYTPRYVSVAR